MVKITENKNYIWLVPLISGIIAIIGILTPTAYLNETEWFNGAKLKSDIYWWIWSFVSMSASISEGGYSESFSENRFVSDSAFLIPSLITTFIIVFVAVNLFILAKSTKTKSWDSKIFMKSSLISASLLIGTMIIYMIVIDAVVYDGVDFFGTGSSAGFRFWSEFDIGFGIIAPFISASLVIIGAGIFRYYSKREDKVAPIRPEIIGEKPVQIRPIMDDLKFCHSCGAKIKKSSAYCEHCGVSQ